MIVAPSKQLITAALDILTNRLPGLMTIRCQLFSPDNEKFLIEPVEIKQLTILQQFNTNYMDVMQLGLELTPQQYIDLTKNYQNLRCLLIFQRVDKTTYARVENLPPLKSFTRAIVQDMADLLKKYNINQLIPSKDAPAVEGHHALRIPVTFQLFEPAAYDLRHVQFNGLLKQVRMQDVLYYVANIFKAKRTKITPPDNTKVYNTLLLPPMLNIGNAFDFLQQRYGVYSKGLEYYFQNETLYVYPAYETEPKTPTSQAVIQIYNVPEPNYSGCDGYHCYRDTDMLVLANGKTEVANLATQGIENQGNAVVTLRAETAIDLNQSTTGTSTQLNGQGTMVCGLTSTNQAVAGRQNPRYSTATDNAFAQASMMSSYNCTMVATPWDCAEPFVIKPGQKVVFHYDDQGRYRTQPGIVETVSYSFGAENRIGQFIYKAVALLVLRLTPDTLPTAN